MKQENSNNNNKYVYFSAGKKPSLFGQILVLSVNCTKKIHTKSLLIKKKHEANM